MQTRGLVVLLMAKAAGPGTERNPAVLESMVSGIFPRWDISPCDFTIKLMSVDLTLVEAGESETNDCCCWFRRDPVTTFLGLLPLQSEKPGRNHGNDSHGVLGSYRSPQPQEAAGSRWAPRGPGVWQQDGCAQWRLFAGECVHRFGTAIQHRGGLIRTKKNEVNKFWGKTWLSCQL